MLLPFRLKKIKRFKIFYVNQEAYENNKKPADKKLYKHNDKHLALS